MPQNALHAIAQQLFPIDGRAFAAVFPGRSRRTEAVFDVHLNGYFMDFKRQNRPLCAANCLPAP